MPSKQSFSVLFLCAALLGQYHAVAQDRAVRIERNVVYGMYSGLALLMDVYTPATPNGYGIVIVPATGWASPLEYGTPGIKNNAVSEFLPILQAGYTLFAINHRTTPRFRFPAPLEDVQRAVRFIRYNAKNYGIDSARIGGAGGSSGGHLLGLLAMLRESGIDDDPDPVNRQPATLQALVLRAPATDLKAMSHFTEGRGLPNIIAFLGVAWPIDDRADQKLFVAASPISHVSAGAPPVLLIHGDDDKSCPFEQSAEFEAALRAVGVPVKLLRIPGGDHGPDFRANGKPHPEWPNYREEMVNWLDQHLKNAVVGNGK